MRNPTSGHGSVSGWVGVRGRQVGCEGDRGKYREGWRVVDTFYTQLARRYTVKYWAFQASVGMAGAGTGVASGLGSVTGCVVGSPRLGEGNRGGSNGIIPVGSPRIWLEPRCLGQSFDVSVVGLH